MMVADWLQVTAMALLGIVLTALGKYLYDRDKKSQEFMQRLITKASDQQEVHVTAWKELMLMAVRGQEGTTAVLTEIKGVCTQHEAASVMRHEDMKRELRLVVKTNPDSGETDARPDKS